MTTPLILNVVIVTTKGLLHVYHCQYSILVKFNGTAEPPKGTVPFGKGIARTLVYTSLVPRPSIT